MLTRAYCKACKSQTPHEVTGPNHMRHLLVTVFTAGLWFPVWLFRALTVKNKNCRECGKRKGLLG